MADFEVRDVDELFIKPWNISGITTGTTILVEGSNLLHFVNSLAVSTKGSSGKKSDISIFTDSETVINLYAVNTINFSWFIGKFPQSLPLTEGEDLKISTTGNLTISTSGIVSAPLWR